MTFRKGDFKMERLIQCLILVSVFASASLGAFDYEITNTYEYGIFSLNNESLLVNGAGAYQIDAKGASYVEIENTLPLQVDIGGIYGLILDDNSTMNYFGGETGSLNIYEDAFAVLEGGRIDYISSYQFVHGINQKIIKHITIDCLDWNHNTATNLLTGHWNDNSAFSIQLVDQANYDPVIDNIHFIPEPATLALFVFGGLLIRRKR